MKLKSSLIRLLVLTSVIAVGGVLFAKRAQLAGGISSAVVFEKLKSVAANINTQSLVEGAQKKLVERQPIIEDSTESDGQVAGAAMSLTTQTRQVIEVAAQSVQSSLQHLPKEQAAAAIRQVCEQIATELESGPTPTETEPEKSE